MLSYAMLACGRLYAARKREVANVLGTLARLAATAAASSSSSRCCCSCSCSCCSAAAAAAAPSSCSGAVASETVGAGGAARP